MASIAPLLGPGGKMSTADRIIDEVAAVLSGDEAQLAEEEANARIDAAIRKDKLTRYEGRPEQDRDIFGRPLRAGS